METNKRPADLPKGGWGKLLILAGNSHFAGAAVLNTLGALRTGVDLVVVAAPERAANAVLFQAPDAITLALSGKVFEPAHRKVIERFIDYTVVIGSGIGTDGATQKFVKQVLKRLPGPFVIDADALTMISQEKNPAKLWDGKTVILTPNRSEYARLAHEQTAQPAQSIGGIAQQYQATILCKGETDYVAGGGKQVSVSGGSAMLAKAGSGDVLTGAVGALVARGVEPVLAAETASKLVKQAGELGEKERGAGLLASDLPGYFGHTQNKVK